MTWSLESNFLHKKNQRAVVNRVFPQYARWMAQFSRGLNNLRPPEYRMKKLFPIVTNSLVLDSIFFFVLVSRKKSSSRNLGLLLYFLYDSMNHFIIGPTRSGNFFVYPNNSSMKQTLELLSSKIILFKPIIWIIQRLK